VTNREKGGPLKGFKSQVRRASKPFLASKKGLGNLKGPSWDIPNLTFPELGKRGGLLIRGDKNFWKGKDLLTGRPN